MNVQGVEENNPFYRTVVLRKLAWEIHLQVPWKIQRVDSKDSHGWQVRHGTSQEDNTSVFFSDKKYGGPHESLVLACQELEARLRLNPPSHIVTKRRTTQSNKKDKGLPDGVYGPCKRTRKVKVRGRLVEKIRWSYDSSCQVMNSRTGVTRTSTKHFAWTGAKLNPKSKEKLQAATAWREESYAEYVEACAKWDSTRNYRQLKAIGQVVRGLKAEIKKANTKSDKE